MASSGLKPAAGAQGWWPVWSHLPCPVEDKWEVQMEQNLMPCIPHPLHEDQQTRCEGGPSTGIPDTQGEQYRWTKCFFIARVTEICTCVESDGVLLLESLGSLHE